MCVVEQRRLTSCFTRMIKLSLLTGTTFHKQAQFVASLPGGCCNVAGCATILLSKLTVLIVAAAWGGGREIASLLAGNFIQGVSAVLQIKLFYQPSLNQDGVSLTISPAAWRLLAYLLLYNQPHDRLRLVAAIYPDVDEPTARARLRRTIHKLNATPLADCLLVTATTVQINPTADYWLDVADFKRLAGDPTTLAEAAALYQGGLLLNLYDDWLIIERERLHYLYVGLLENLLQTARSNRDYAAAIDYARRLLAIEPLHEFALRQLLTVRYLAGDRTGALNEYTRFATFLQTKLGSTPTLETVALYTAIQRNQPLPGTTISPSSITSPTNPKLNYNLPLIGRETELGQLTAAWEQAAAGCGSVVFVSGEAGIGKSRLAAEISTQVEAAGGRVLFGQTAAQETQPYQAVVQVLRAGLPLLTGTGVDSLALRALLPLLPELTAHGLTALPALTPTQEQARLYWAVATTMQAMARGRPLLVVLEDLHAATAATISLLRAVVEGLSEHPLLLLATYREEEVERAHPLRELRAELVAAGSAQVVALSRLEQTAVQVLVAQVPGLEAVSAALALRSDGHPFFLSELIASWLAGNETSLPAGVQQLIAARTARLKPNSRLAAEVAVVLGTTFSVETLREVTGWDERQAQSAISELLDRRLVREEGSSGIDYAFSHQLIQETIYAGLTEDVRQRRHQRAGLVLEEMLADAADRPAELARHFDLGGDAARAARHYRRAAEQALKVYADDEALAALSRAQVLTSGAQVEFELRAMCESIHARRGEREAQAVELAAMQELAEQLRDLNLKLEASRRLVVMYGVLGERGEQQASLQQLSSYAKASGAAQWLADSHYEWADYYLAINEYSLSIEEANAALAIYRQLGDGQQEMTCYCIVAHNRQLLGDNEAANEIMNHVLATFREAEHSVRAYQTAAQAAYVVGDYSVAMARAEKMLAICQQGRLLAGQAIAYAIASFVLYKQGHIRQASERLQASIALATKIGYQNNAALNTGNLGLIYALYGRADEAIALLEQAAVMFERTNARLALSMTTASLMIAFNALGNYERSQQLGQAWLTEHPVAEPERRGGTLVQLGIAERGLGNAAAAVSYHQTALAAYLSIDTDEQTLLAHSELAVSYLAAGRLADAQQEVAALLALSPRWGSVLDHSSYPYWVAAITYHAADDMQAHSYLHQAYGLLQAQIERIADPDWQASFMTLPLSRQLVAAYERDEWPNWASQAAAPMPACPTCQQADSVERAGRNQSGSQRLRCTRCARYFTATPKAQGHTAELRAQARALQQQGHSLRAIARQLAVSHATVRSWLQSD